MEYKETLTDLLSLVSPLETTLRGEFGSDPEKWFEDLLKKKLEHLVKSSIPDNKDIRWEYVQFSLERLKTLRNQIESLKEIESDGPIFSVQQQKSLTSLLQMIFGMGIIPYLIPGVGLPIEKRSKFMEMFAKQKNVPDDKKRKRIVIVVNEILDLSTGPEELSGIIVAKNFGDILAALIQLGYAPLQKPKNSVASENGEFVMTQEMYEKLSEESNYFREKYTNFIDRVYQPLVVKYLLVLQSGNRVPQWVKTVVGESLSSRLMRKNGVINVINGVLDAGGEEDVKKFQVIAKVLSSPPSSYSYGDVEKYYEVLCPQILNILLNGGAVYKSIACFCIRSISDRSLTLSRRHCTSFLIKPFTLFSTPELRQSDLPDEETFSKSVDILHYVFVLGTDPSIVFLGHLDPIIEILLTLHCSITFGVSHLKKPIQEILVRYFKHSTEEHALQVLRSFAFGENYFQVKTQVLHVNENVIFVPGDGGGTVPRIKGVETNANFYVEDDEKSIAIVDLASEISRNMTLELFMSLVKDLTAMMTESEDKVDIANDLSCCDTESKLLNLEREMDITMNRLRKNLMVIRLLGLLSEEDQLQDDISKNSSRMIQFISLTIERGAQITQNRVDRKKLQNGSDEVSSGILEAQSLSMALTILSVNLLDGKNIKSSDWEDLRKISHCFKILEESYEDERVRLMAKKLRTLVLTHGVVLESTADLQGKVNTIKETTDKIRKMKDQVKQIEEEERKRTPYESALYDLTDPLLPVRGSGLIRLANLIDDSDSETLKNIEKVFNIFMENLADNDSYIYLTAINGLLAVAGKTSNQERILERLLKEFELSKKREEKCIEIKTKIGEALVKITSLMGEITPKYKNLLLNGFFHRISDTDEMVRASIWSNLGQVCKNLKFSLGNDVHEIFMLLDSTLKFDASIQVRRSAVLVISLLLNGLGKHVFDVLKDKLRDVYRTLKSLERSENDEAMILHTQTAIEEIDKIVKDFMTPDSTLKKTIYVLDPPPEPF